MIGDDPVELLERLDLREYEATALAFLLSAGRSTAPEIADATDIPQARVYGVLDSLADMGYVKVFPGRPKEFQSKSPESILDRAMENRRQEYEEFRSEIESFRDTFLETFEPRFEQASADITPAAELVHVVDVGEASLTETRRLYNSAENAVYVITNSFAYLEAVEPALEASLDRDVDVSVLFLDPVHLPAEKADVQADIVDHLDADYPAVEYRFSNESLPLRGTFVDPSMDYDTGEAIFLVEEPDVPDHKRQAAITENGSLVAGMKRYFDLIWEHESTDTRE